MNIKDILDSLGLDLTDPEVKRGATEAIDAILQSRIPPSSLDLGSTTDSDEIDIELDPDLIQPSQKHQSTTQNNDDIEIEDEDQILDQIQHNESEVDTEGDSDGSDLSADDEDTSNNQNSDSAEEATDSDDLEDKQDLEDSTGSGEAGQTSQEDDADSEFSNESEEDSLETDDNAEETFDTEEDSEEDSDEIDISDDSEEFSETDSESEEEEELFDDEEDYLDDELKDTFDDKEKQTKQEARKIKRERTLQAARKVLETAKTNKAAPSLIRELESSIEALESLTEAVTKNLYDISDDEFNMMVNRVFDAMEAIGDTGLTYTTQQERELQAQEIKADLESGTTKQELSAEDVAQIRAETQAVKARERENNKYKKRASGSFKGFQEFLKSLYRAIALQVQTNEVQDDSWSAINRRYSGTSVLQPGKKLNELPNNKIPVIDFYFDCSGSWDNYDIQIGTRAVEALAEMEDKGQIKINIYYFSDNVHTDLNSARNEGGTTAWNKIVKNIIATQATNVIIMTDSDMEDRWCSWHEHEPNALNYTVPGYVWYLWKDGDNAPRLPRDLKGRGGVQQFSFSHGDL